MLSAYTSYAVVADERFIIIDTTEQGGHKPSISRDFLVGCANNKLLKKCSCYLKRTTIRTYYILLLSHISISSFVWGIGKQCISRSDATESGVLSGSSLFGYNMIY